MARFFKLFLTLLVLTPSQAGAAMPQPIAEALREAKVGPAAVSIAVQEVGARRPTLLHNAQDARNPASVMKLVTTYAALELLGPAYRWKTEAYLDGEDLVLKGSGDPKLSYEAFWILLRNLRARGVQEIRDLVVDRSQFTSVALPPIDNELFRPYNVLPDALLVNFKTLRFAFLPQADRVRLFVEPRLPGLEVVNGLRIAQGPCPEGRAFRDLTQAVFQSKPPRAAFGGLYPESCAEKELLVALHHPDDYLSALFRLLWTELGGVWRGAVREGTVPPSAKLLYTHESEPLAAIVRDINKFSNNVMARQLYLTLAAALDGPPAHPDAARRIVAQWLVFKGIEAPELVLENGSGLSRLERASAATLMALLQAAWSSAVMPEFVASLPVAAGDGTMRRRMHGEPVAGNAQQAEPVTVGPVRPQRAQHQRAAGREEAPPDEDERQHAEREQHERACHDLGGDERRHARGLG